MAADSIPQKVVAILKDLRTQQGMTLEELADRSGLHRTSISLLERGERLPTLQVVTQLAQALGQDLSFIIKQAEEPGNKEAIKPAVPLSQFQKREADPVHFKNNDYLIKTTGLNVDQLKKAIDATYSTTDLIDYQLVSRTLPPIELLVELANLSSMLGNIIGAELAAASNGLYKRNRPHTYPDLLPIKSPAVELELKVALETNRPKGHLPKPGTYITFRYVLSDRNNGYSRGKSTRGDTAWIWEVRVGQLLMTDFSISNTEGDSGKTAVIKTEAFHNMKVIYFNPSLLPYGNQKRLAILGLE